jgi:hypothetical protein
MEEVTGKTPDKSEYLDFTFYDWEWYKDNAVVGENLFWRWLGVTHPANGQVISRTTVQQVTNSLNSDSRSEREKQGL